MMKALLWLLAGTAVGFAVAKRLGAVAGARNVLADLDAKAREFGAAVAESYRAREAELRAAIRPEASEPH